ncbi:MAG TPA: hypothetical protein VNW98_04440 [Burkholderiaceae bacterium]|jgi:hypothetical protein|nr:hypothetical protein [Burkholderiaceae bacterium]
MEADKARVFAVVSWGCAATNWLARALNSHPDIFCVHAGNFYWHHYGRAPYLDGPEYLATIREMGSSYASAGDVHGVDLRAISAIRETFGDQFACAIVVREPIARLYSQVALFKSNLHTRAWNVDYVQRFIDQGIALPVDSYENRLTLHGISMLNSIVTEQATARVWRCEDLTTQPEALAEFVSEITGGSVSVDPGWAQATVALPAVFQHAKSDQPLADRRPQDWQVDAIRKIVLPKAWNLYSQLGYVVPDFL